LISAFVVSILERMRAGLPSSLPQSLQDKEKETEERERVREIRKVNPAMKYNSR